MSDYIKPNTILCGDSKDLLKKVKKHSIALSIWSPPKIKKPILGEMTLKPWKKDIEAIIHQHKRVLKDGGFMVIVVPDYVFEDKKMPLFRQIDTDFRNNKLDEETLRIFRRQHPDYTLRQIAEYLQCSRSKVAQKNTHPDRKYPDRQERFEMVGGYIQEYAKMWGLYLYDRRIWKKKNLVPERDRKDRSYRAKEDYEYIYVFWKPVRQFFVNRERLTDEEWDDWGRRLIWDIEDKEFDGYGFPKELPLRLIKLLSDKGDIILDPFMRYGSTMVAAKLLGRQYIGFDKWRFKVESAEEKLEKIR